MPASHRIICFVVGKDKDPFPPAPPIPFFEEEEGL